MASSKKPGLLVALFLILVAGIYGLNASWLAPKPNGNPTIFAHRGVHQLYDRENLGRDDCTATRIYPPTHDFLENTLRSMALSFEYGADVLELDVHPTTDNEFVVFHDWTLDCRTDGTGVTRSRDLKYLKSLDIGYGYTADAGETFPFRGSSQGMMPTLEEVYRAFPDKEFLINIKSNRAEEADKLYNYIQDRQLLDQGESIMVYGGEKPVARINSLTSEALAPSRSRVKQCAKDYILFGWTSIVPESCKNTAILIPANKTHLFWGWPNRFIERMNTAGTYVMVLGNQTATGINGVVQIEEIEDLPPGFNGGIWVETIEILGPYIRENFGSEEE